jgi:predicted nucleic acid-binding protein
VPARRDRWDTVPMSAGTTTLDDVAVWTITAALPELELTPEIRRAAAALATSVRSLDAIHVATARRAVCRRR